MARNNQNPKPTDQNETPTNEGEVQNGNNGTTVETQEQTETKPTDQNETPTNEGDSENGGDSASFNKDLDKTFIVSNPNKAGKTILAASGKVIEFDENGKATVEYSDAEYLSKIDGYSVEEKK